MATIYDAIRGEVQTSDDYVVRDPFWQTGAQLQQNYVQPQTSSQAVWGPMVQALVGGILTGIGKKRARETEFDAYKAAGLQEAMAAQLTGTEGTEGFGPVASGDVYGKNVPVLNSVYMQEDAPEGWTGATGKKDLLKAMMQQEAVAKAAEEQRKYNLELQMLRDKGPIEAINAGLVEAAKKNLSGKASDPINSLTDPEKIRYASVGSIAKELEALADKAAKLKSNAAGLLSQRLRADSPLSELQAEAELVLSNVRKAGNDTGNVAVQEQATALEALMGDLTAGSQTIAKRFRNAASQLRRISSGSLETRIAGETEGIEAFRKSISGVEAANEAVPTGEFTKTGKPVFILNGVKVVKE
jgi:hypothetical protein